MKSGKTVLLLLGAALGSIYVYFQWEKLYEVCTVLSLAVGISLLLSPVCLKLEKTGFRPAWAAATTVVGFSCVMLMLLLMFVPYIISQSIALLRQISPILIKLSEKYDLIGTIYDNTLDSIPLNAFTSAIGAATTTIARGGISAALFAGKFGFALVLAFYFLKERRKLGAHALLCIDVSNRRFLLSALEGCRNALRSYLSGMIKTCIFVGGATYLGLKILRIQNAFLLALYMGVFEIFPFVGPVVAAIPILLSSMSGGIRHAMLSLILIVFVQQMESSFVGPYFTASSTSIHPLAALISVFVMGTLLGLPGILLAIPLYVTLRSMYWSICRLRYGHTANLAE